jgi:hypothetical protein
MGGLQLVKKIAQGVEALAEMRQVKTDIARGESLAMLQGLRTGDNEGGTGTIIEAERVQARAFGDEEGSEVEVGAEHPDPLGGG